MIKKLKHLSYEESLRELSLFSLEKTLGDLTVSFQYLKGAYKQEGAQLFTPSECDRTRGNGFKLKQGRFRLDVWKKYFTQKVISCWNKLPRDFVDSPSLEVFKAGLDEAHGNLTLYLIYCWQPCLLQGVGT